MEIETRPIHEIAEEIEEDWAEKVWYGARPYLDAMYSLNKITEDFGCDRGEMIVAYFLGNAQTWRGETARRVKKELKAMLK